jgi:hypothetical protein
MFDWVRRGREQDSGAPGAGQRRASCKPRLERLEDRYVPAAIRALPGFTVNSLAANDDNSTGAVNVGFNLNFFGVQSNTVFVNNNGNITFGSAFPTFTPTALNSSNGGTPIIAPFFADVDTTVGQIVTYGTDTLCGHAAFGVDYINVGYFSSHVDKTNSFQLILVDRSDTGVGNFDIEFNYDRIKWETGDASGGTNGFGGQSAAVGYSNGTGTPGTFFELPGSHVNGALLDGGPLALVTNALQATTPGRYHFLVRGGQVAKMKTGNDDVTSGTRTLDPFRYVTDTTTDIQRGNLTLVNIVPTSQTTVTDACLDITTTTQANSNTTYPGPITVVFTQLPPNVTLVNPTGVTAAGHPYITEDVADLPREHPVLRVAIRLRNPSLQAPSTFFVGFPTQVFAGVFDPTMD